MFHLDLSRTTRIADFQVGSVDEVKRTVELPAGIAKVIFVVPNGKCDPIDAATIIQFKMYSANAVLLDQAVRLANLTWSYGNSCDTYGFRRSGADDKTPSPNSFELEVNIPRDDRLVQIEAGILASNTSKGRRVYLWATYDGLVPAGTVYSRDDRSPRSQSVSEPLRVSDLRGLHPQSTRPEFA
jgi:hypothetical protein